MNARIRFHNAVAYPHQGACGACYDAKLCNWCGKKLDAGHCTNGRCSKCHGEICTPGGVVSEGHGFGRVGTDWRKIGRPEEVDL